MEHDPNGKNLNDPGAKADAGKRRADLLLGFSRALEAVADVLTHGAEKYSPGGWEKVPCGVERYTAAMFRHLLAEGRGEEIDAPSGLRHAAQTARNALARLELMLRVAEEKDTGGVPTLQVMRRELIQQVLHSRRCPSCQHSFIPNDETAESGKNLLRRFL